MARTPVQAPIATEPAYGLIAASGAKEPQEENDGDTRQRWPLGTTFLAEACGEVNIGFVNACTNDDTGFASDTEQGENVNTDAYYLAVLEDCTTLDGTWRDFQARARRALLAGQSYALAQELWDGGAAAPASPNIVFAGGASLTDTVTSSAVAPAVALGCLVQALGHALHGGKGMIHVTDAVLVALVAAQAVTQKGNLWVTPKEHIVVADSGYSGSSPAGADPGSSQWMYASPMLDITLGPIRFFAGGDTVETIVASTNDRRVWAQRTALIQPQRNCGLFAAETNVGGMRNRRLMMENTDRVMGVLPW